MKSLRNLFTEDTPEIQEIYRQCTKMGYQSHGAGDMWEPSYRPEDIVKALNKVVNQFIEENGVKVYARGNNYNAYAWTNHQLTEDTHSAILIDIQPLKQCEHKEAIFDNLNGTWFKCRNCGKPVKAKGWETV